jgi:hypothetical protein
MGLTTGTLVLGLALSVIGAGVVDAAGRVLFSDPLDGSGAVSWKRAPSGFVAAPGGGRALRYERGTTWDQSTQPWVGDESWATYTVEVEVLPEKMWAGIDFHVSDDGERGTSLTLFHTPENTLAFELAGIWGQAGAWKLWPMGQRQPPHKPGSWVWLRVEVGAGVANVYVDEERAPAATFYDLPFSGGGVRLATYAGSALFRNLRVARLKANEAPPLLADPWEPTRGADVLRDWRISPRYEKGAGAVALPEEITNGSVRWERPPIDGRGVVSLTGLFAELNTSGVVFARTTINAKRTGTRRLFVTYTDHLALWCNGIRVFEGPPRQWFHPDRAKHGNSRLIPDQYEVSVPVLPGRNELIVRSEITEPFGWGFWVRDADRERQGTD